MSTIRENQIVVETRDSQGELRELLASQRKAFRTEEPSYQKRVASLRQLEEVVLDRKAEIVAAVNEDFGGRARQETLALELVPLLDSIRHTRRKLASWMKPQSVRAGINFFPASARIVYQPLGVIGIIGAWNYPTLLTLSPLVDAIAAGNHAMVKPSELSPRVATLLKQMLAMIFPREYIAVVTGDATVATAFASLPFDHLLFTGSTRVGKLVMRSASENLTPVTLELGGKSPAIVHPEFPLRMAVERILTGKLYNAGQTCLAPDYVFVHESQRDQLVQIAREVAQKLYPTFRGNADYTRIINQAHYQRLSEWVADATSGGARAIALGELDQPGEAESRVFVPILLLDVNDTMQVMREEIFGPILPVLTYRSLEEAVSYVASHPDPLALYYFDFDSVRVERMLRSTRSGGVTINDVIYHIAQNDLPFGGLGQSGMGHYHGHAGFETFSKKKGVMIQKRLTTLSFLRPPYGPMADRVIRFLLRK